METSSENVNTCIPPAADHLDGCGYLCGYPISHSLSPLLHRTIFKSLGLNWDYFALQSKDLDQFMNLVRSSRCYGSGVTMPHKVAIMPRLDDITPECKAIGACNTIFRRGSQLVGTNTDVVGVWESFNQNVKPSIWEGRPGMVVGGGGAARSAVYALVKFMKCSPVYLVNRDRDEVRALIDWCKSSGYGDSLIDVTDTQQAEALEGPGAIVACVPDFPPKTKAELEVRSIVENFLERDHKGALLEMCYHPVPWTELGGLAEAYGWNVILGTEAMMYQGFEQSRLWTGSEHDDLPIEETKAAIAQALAEARQLRAKGTVRL